MNKLIKIAALGDVPMTSVDYMGGTVDIPAHHAWIGIIKANVCNYATYLMVSFRDEPAISASGNLIVQEGNEHCVLEQVGMMPFGKATLRKVQGLSADEVLDANREELQYKVTQIIEHGGMSVEDKVHELLCPHHGVVADFFRHQIPTAAAAALQEIEQEKAQQQVAEEAPVNLFASTAAASKEELPAEVQQMIAELEAQGASVKVIQFG